MPYKNTDELCTDEHLVKPSGWNTERGHFQLHRAGLLLTMMWLLCVMIEIFGDGYDAACMKTEHRSLYCTDFFVTQQMLTNPHWPIDYVTFNKKCIFCWTETCKENRLYNVTSFISNTYNASLIWTD